jgi:chromosome segregation ATPase
VARSIRPLIVVLCVFAATTGFAQEETAEERLQRLEKQLAEQRAINEQQRILLEEMQAELARLRFESAGPATAAEFEDTAETAEVEAEAEETVVRGLSLEISGWMNLDTIYDFDRVAPDYEETLVPTTIPTVPGRNFPS